MRTFFADVSRLRKIAKNRHNRGASSLERWWTGKYKLPANSDSFKSRTWGALMLEYFEDLHQRKADLLDQLEDASPEETTRIHQVVRGLDKALMDSREDDAEFEFDPESDDPLIAEWLKDLRDGKMPNLKKGLHERE